jgi:hypothetical protein
MICLVVLFAGGVALPASAGTNSPIEFEWKPCIETMKLLRRPEALKLLKTSETRNIVVYSHLTGSNDYLIETWTKTSAESFIITANNKKLKDEYDWVGQANEIDTFPIADVYISKRGRITCLVRTVADLSRGD